jgi:multimeric flavodoxin WrbA
MKSENFIIIQGSSKSNGNTRKIVDYVLSKKEGQFIDLKTKEISYFDYEHKNVDDDFINVMKSVLKFETIIFATPVYWYSMSALMKTFIDRISDLLKIRKDLGRQLRGKNMMVIACSSDNTEYPSLWEPFKLSAEYLGMEYLGNAHTWVESDSVPLDVRQSLDLLLNKLK